MATRFAVKTGNWSDTTLWDNGALPVSGDVIYPNGFTVTIDQDINVNSLNNNISNVYLANMNIPNMTSNTQPSGTANASSNTTIAFQAFDQNSSTQWNATTNNTGWVSFDYGTNKLIKRYYLKGIGNYPTAWNFEGYNTSTSSWDILETKSGTNSSLGYASPLLTHTTQYSLYRINVTTNSNISFPPQITNFEMTESTSASFGATTGGSFTVPNTLSGTRNIVQSGSGIISNTSSVGVVNIAALTGNTVNFNISGGGVIFAQQWSLSSGASNAVQITGNCTVNFNADIYANQNSFGTGNGNINLNANAIVNINGNIYAPKNTGSTSPIITAQATNSNSATINLNGNIIGTTDVNAVGYSIIINSLATLNITGNITSNLASCVYSTSGCTVSLTGTATVTNANSSPAIYLTSTSSLLTINGSITNKGNVNAILAAKIRFVSTATPYWIYQTNAGTDMTLAYGSATGAYPNEADVRFGVTYAASPTRTGTCRVPLPQYVSQGVLVDATVGTAYLSATDVWNVLTSTITTSGSIGERLKNASTVQTTGDQLASYQV